MLSTLVNILEFNPIFHPDLKNINNNFLSASDVSGDKVTI